MINLFFPQVKHQKKKKNSEMPFTDPKSSEKAKNNTDIWSWTAL